MARPMKPLVRGGGYYPSNGWTPLVYQGGYTTANGGGQPEPEAVLKTVTGSLIHITDALALPAEALTVNVNPIQDLNGYDNPWPAGGGVNLLPPYSLPSITDQGVTLTHNNGEYTLNGKTDSNVAVFDVNVNLPAGQYTVALNNPTVNSNVQIYGVDENVTVPLQVQCTTANTTATATFAATVKIFRIRVLANGTVDNFKLSPVFSAGATAATKFYPYSNICPISGWAGAKVTRTGRNLLNLVSSQMESTGWDREFPISLTAGTYIISCQNQFGASKKGAKVDLLDDGNNVVSTLISNYNFGDTVFIGTPTTITREAALKIKKIRFNCRAGGTSFDNIAAGLIQLELGSTATAYEPYQGQTYTIQLGDTVYGGTLDVTTGKLTVDRAIVDLGTLSWNGWETDGVYIFYAAISGKVQSRASVCISLQYVYNKDVHVWTDLLNAQMTGAVGNANIYIKDNRYNSISDFSTAMDGVQLVYELATPIEVDLTPTEITLLLGENNLWSDAGDMTLTYYADGNASDIEALNILLGNRYYSNHEADEPTDREALDILLGNTR